jgi:hypothetical protein
MEAREGDVALLRRLGVWPSALEEHFVSHLDASTMPVAGSPREPLSLEWGGWDAIYAWTDVGAEVLESTAAALPYLRRLSVVDPTCAAVPLIEETAVGLAAVLRKHPIQELYLGV